MESFFTKHILGIQVLCMSSMLIAIAIFLILKLMEDSLEDPRFIYLISMIIVIIILFIVIFVVN